MLLDQTLDILTKSAWIFFILVMLIYFVRTLYYQGFGAALQIWVERRTLISFLALLSLTVLSFSLVFVEPQNVGVVVSIVSPEGIREQPERSGLRWIVPFAEEIYMYPIHWQTYTMSATPLEGQEIGDDSIVARTYDGQEVIIDCTVIFRLETEQAVRIHIDWQNRYIEDFIRPYLRGIIRTEVSQFTIDEINSFKRRDLEARLDDLLREELASKGFVLDKFVLRNISYSGIYAASVEQKQVALQQITQMQYQASQIQALAQGEAARQIIAANAEATAIAIVSMAEAEALQRIAAAVADNPDLLTYEYISKIAPGVQVMLLPSDNPFILNVPNLSGTMTPTPTPTPLFTPTPTLTPTPTVTPTAVLPQSEP